MLFINSKTRREIKALIPKNHKVYLLVTVVVDLLIVAYPFVWTIFCVLDREGYEVFWLMILGFFICFLFMSASSWVLKFWLQWLVDRVRK